MANVTGTRLTLTDTVGLAVDMCPTIKLIDPFDVGLLQYFGMSSLEKACTETEHKWMEDTLRPLTSTILDNPLTNVATTINVNTGDGVIFRKGDIVKIENELIRLSADPSTDALTTVASHNGRGWGSTTAAQHAQNLAIEIVSVTWAEGEGTPGLSRQTTKSSVSNYTQIFEDVVQVSSTLEAVEQWAPGGEYARQLAKTMKTLMILMDKTFIYGSPIARAAANGNTGAMGGLRNYIVTNVTAMSSVQMTEQSVLDQFSLVEAYGGNTKLIAFKLKQKQAFNKFLDAARRVSIDQKTAGAVVDSINWDNGVVDTLIDRWIASDEAFYLEADNIGFGPLSGSTLRHEVLPKSSLLLQKGEVAGEYTCEVKAEKSHARQTGLATTLV